MGRHCRLARALLPETFVFEIESVAIKEHESSAVSQAITALAVRLARLERTPLVQPQLRLCYLLPAEDGQLAFQGMRLRTHDPATGTLTIDASVPLHIVDDTSKAGPYVLAVAADAIDAAQEFFLEQGIRSFDAETLQAWVTTVKPADLAPAARQQVRNTDFGFS